MGVALLPGETISNPSKTRALNPEDIMVVVVDSHHMAKKEAKETGGEGEGQEGGKKQPLLGIFLFLIPIP